MACIPAQLTPQQTALVLLCALGLKVGGFLKTRNIALPPQMCSLGYLGMSAHALMVHTKSFSNLFEEMSPRFC